MACYRPPSIEGTRHLTTKLSSWGVVRQRHSKPFKRPSRYIRSGSPLRPIRFAGVLWRNTNAPSLTNRFAVASPIPLLRQSIWMCPGARANVDFLYRTRLRSQRSPLRAEALRDSGPEDT
jgi:hypothetical protein